jgi:predicted O-methyltransferase YrrM
VGEEQIESIRKYIEAFLAPTGGQIVEITGEYSSGRKAPPPIGLQAGRFMGFLARTMKASRILEFGTALGYSTVWLAEAAKASDGRLVAVESDSGFLEETARNVEKAGLSDSVELILGDASEVIETLDGPFDLILQDSAKALYPELLEASIVRTRIGGVLAADDALFRPMGVRSELSEPIHEYVKRIFSDPRLYSTVLPIGDGLALSVKLSE